jgi:hypothetical protein
MVVDPRKFSIALNPGPTTLRPAVSALRTAGVDESRLPTSLPTRAELEVARLKKEIDLLERETMALLKQQLDARKQQVLVLRNEVVQARNQLVAAHNNAAAEQRAQNAGALGQARQFLGNLIGSMTSFVPSFLATLPYPASTAVLVLLAQHDAKQRLLAAAEIDLKEMMLAIQQTQARFDLAREQRNARP